MELTYMAYYKNWDIFVDDDKRDATEVRLLGGPLSFPCSGADLDSLWVSDVSVDCTWYRQTEIITGDNSYSIKGLAEAQHPGSGLVYNIYGMYFIYEDGGDRSYLCFVNWDAAVVWKEDKPWLEIPLTICIQA